MANLGAPVTITAGDTSVVFTTLVHPLGTRAVANNGKDEYIFLAGAANTANNVVVTYDENFATTLIAANAVGPVAVARATVDTTSKYGWYQVRGTGTVSSDTTAADKSLFIDGTAGRVDDAVVTGDLILNMTSTAADTSNVLPVEMNNPRVTDVLG